MPDERIYYPDPASSLEFEWVARQFRRISDALNGTGDFGETLQATEVSSSDSPYTTKDRDVVLLINPGGGTFTLNLQAGTNQRYMYIKNVGTSGSVVVTPNGSDDIDKTGTTWTLTPMVSIHIIYSQADANWYVI